MSGVAGGARERTADRGGLKAATLRAPGTETMGPQLYLLRDTARA